MGSSLTDLGTLSGYTESGAVAINNTGQIVGLVKTIDFAFSTTHGFIYARVPAI